MAENQETPYILEMTTYRENVATGHRDIPVERVTERFPTAYGLYVFYNQHCRIIREGEELKRRLKKLYKREREQVQASSALARAAVDELTDHARKHLETSR